MQEGTVWTIYKVCKICEGAKNIEVTFTDGRKQILQCASCQGKGNYLWGYMKDDGEARKFITE